MSLLGKIKQPDMNRLSTFSKPKTPEIEIKISVIGESGVGKSSLSQRIAYDKFSPDINSTIGAAFCQFRHTQDGVAYSFKLWDTAGQERFNALVPMYLKGSNIVLMVFDITSFQSFERIKNRWYNQVIERTPDSKIILIGNKADLQEKREVKYEYAREYAEAKGFEYFECSAKNHLGLDYLANLFLDVARKINIDKNKDDVVTVEDDVSEKTASCLGHTQCYIF